MPRDPSVVKHNSLIEASYKLTLNEQRLILSCISQLDSRKPLPKDNLFTVTAKEFSKTFGIDEKHCYEALEEAVNSIYERDIKTYDGRCQERFRWVYYVLYHKKEGKVTMGFNPFMNSYLTMLHQQFTSYKLKHVAQLKSVYSFRLFEMLMQFKSTGKFIIHIDKLKKLLEISNNYNRFYDLKRWIIEPAVTELIQKSNLRIVWFPIKTNRHISHLEFQFKDAS